MAVPAALLPAPPFLRFPDLRPRTPVLGAEAPQGYTPAERTAATALRAATRIGSQTGENGGA